MTDFTDFINTLPDYIGIFILMLSTFLIGYFSAWWFQKNKYKGLIERLKKEVNESIISKRIKGIDTVYTEVKSQRPESKRNNPFTKPITSLYQDTLEKTRSNYVTYNRSMPELDFESFGYGDENNKDNLTRIKGVGPYIELKLNEIGIYNFDQVSKLKESDIRIITDLIDFFPGRIERDDWVGQAEALNQN
ncbi:hypothetical protein [Ulvibacter litoralis]|uniref:NADH-quinone oxidoreductase subunit E n=1 Tax=Ulvibacter litoralis TaxID=227084 RepID=A0A1G7FCA9_9FLAO|nr:hypothetical protein [Ulvibacter litoralis]GHC51738.1 hypothetical protein GCM10008083_14290 [Ulvibacter litoralis]SDE73588.1 hypothetical protein SAMN05421855_102475 [Ulvibacter litoralis]